MGLPAYVPLNMVQDQDFNLVQGFAVQDPTIPPQLINSIPIPIENDLVGQIRQYQNASSPVLLDFSSYISVGSATVLNGATVTPVTIAIPASQTYTLPAGQLYYDIRQPISGSSGTYIMYGPCTVMPTGGG